MNARSPEVKVKRTKSQPKPVFKVTEGQQYKSPTQETEKRARKLSAIKEIFALDAFSEIPSVKRQVPNAAVMLRQIDRSEKSLKTFTES